MKNIKKYIEELKKLYDLEYREYAPNELRDITLKYIDIVNNVVGYCYIEPFEWDNRESIGCNIDYFENIIDMLKNELNYKLKGEY